MPLPQKPVERRRRILTALAIGVGAHVLLLPVIAKDAIFKMPAQPRRTSVGLVSQRSTVPRTAAPNSPATPGQSLNLQPKLPKDDLEELRAKEQQKIQGQVVALGQPKDERPPAQPTKYLSEKDSRVLKETRARETSAFFKNALSKIQKEGKNEKRDQPAPVQPQEPPPGVQQSGKQGESSEKPAVAQSGPELPSRERQDRVNIREAPDGTVRNRSANDALKGGSNRLALARPNAPSSRTRPSPGQGNNPLSGAPGGKGKPLNLTLERPLDVLGPVAGGPMPDDLRGVDEGEETLLNSRSFRYAGYLNRVKETVGRIWTQKVQDAAMRRDPTGQQFLYKDRRTVVEFTLDARGEVTGVRVASSSGVPYLDEVAADSFKSAERFPNPPPGLIGPGGVVTMPFAFTLLADTGGFRIQAGPAYAPGIPGQRGY
jgi:TonB family protein